MRTLLACLGLAALPAFAQAPAPSAAPRAPLPACADCGVVRSVSVVEKQQRPTADAGKPSGLVATVPLGGGKVEVGSSTRLGKDTVVTEKQWNVVVQMDDGRFRVVTVEQQGDWQQGDRVHVEGSRLSRIGAAQPSPTPTPAIPK
jgi:hypothetical protein